MSLTSGSRLGSYDVVSALGAGGMGEVYRARDRKLDRDVAIKVLPVAFVHDPLRRSRFDREAKVLATLNHANIACIYGLEDDGATTAIVMELVEGPTLAERIARGPLPRAEALSVALQLAAAIEYAHGHGIVHRDLKPANIKVRPDGTVKVLDFGIARALESSEAMTAAATITALDTRAGTVIGTPAYMSPEQARGEPIDERTDIWAFGCVVYEMLVGRRPFPGETAEVFAAVLGREPDWKAIGDTSPAIQRLLRRSLQKDPRRRLRAIGDARLDIEDAQAGADFEQPPVRSTLRRRVLPLTMMGVVAFAAGASYVYWRGAGPASSTSASALVAAARFQRVTDIVGVEESPAISPDGKTVAFVAYSGGRRQIWIRLLVGGAPYQLTHADLDHDQPRWGGDSTSVFYFTHSRTPGGQGTLSESPMFGGEPRRIAATFGGADISHGGQEIALFQAVDGASKLVVIRRNGSFVRVVTEIRPGWHRRVDHQR